MIQAPPQQLSWRFWRLIPLLLAFAFFVPARSAGQAGRPVLRVPLGHTAPINTMVFSPNGKWIASGSTDNSVIIWDAQTGADIRTIYTGMPVWHIHFSVEENFVFTVSGEAGAEHTGGKHQLKKWDLLTGKLLDQYNYSGKAELALLPSQAGFLLAENSSLSQKVQEVASKTDMTDPAAVNKIDYSKLINSDSMAKEFTRRLGELNKELSKIDPKDKKAMEEYQRKVADIYMDSYGGMAKVNDKSMWLYSGNSFKSREKLTKTFDKAVTVSYNGRDYIITPETSFMPAAGEAPNQYKIWDISMLLPGKTSQPPVAYRSYPVKSNTLPVYVSKTKGYFAIPVQRNSAVQLWQLDKEKTLTEFKVFGKILNRVEFSPDGEMLYVFSQTADLQRREIHVEGWSTRDFKRTLFLNMPANYQTGEFRIAASGSYFISAAAFPSQHIIQYNWNGDSTGVLGGRAGAPSYFGFTPDDRQVYSNFLGQPDIKEFMLASVTAGVENEAYRKGTKLSRQEKDKLVMDKLKIYPFYNLPPYHGYNLVWDLETGGTKIAAASPFSLDHRAVSKDKNYSLRNEEYSSGIQMNTYMLNLLRKPAEGVSPETMAILNKYSDTSSLFYKTVFAGRKNGPVTQLINNRTKDTISLVKIDSLEWIMVLKNGYYMSSKNAAKVLAYVSGMNVYPFEQFDLRYNRPDKVLQAIGKSSPELIEAYRKAYQKRIRRAGIDSSQFRDELEIPAAEIMNLSSIPAQQSGASFGFTIKGSDKSTYLDRYNVWVNEVPVFGKNGKSVRDQKKKEIIEKIEFNLSEGMNRIEVSVMNSAGVESYRVPLFIRYSPPNPVKTKMYFVGIGIDQFSNKQYNLQYSSKDIRDLANQLKEKYKDNIVIDTLFNTNVTAEKIKALKQKLKQTGENDKVVISYSGHGLLSKDFDYFLSTYSINFDKPEENGLPYDELENLLDHIPARKKLLLIDACHSGEVDKEEMTRMELAKDALQKEGTKGGKPTAIGKTTLGMKNSFELMQSLFVNVGKSTGATVISAAAGTQFALERGDLKNGVFTYSILEAMNKYPSIKISELRKIVGERVEKLTNGLQKPTSRNETIASDWTL